MSDQGKIDIELEISYSVFENELKKESYVERNDGTKIELTTTTNYDFTSNVETIECIYEDTTGNKESEIIKVKHYNEDEFKNLAILAGFKEVKICKMLNDNIILFRCIK